uniref:Uncharacterized protein n=1 Tax=Nothobranchius kadleci TaxID=1051664 RepID=A0A1A8BW82_NOTKA
MESMQNSSFSRIEITFWSSSVNNAIVVLGLLTFALQLCLLLLFMLRCWRFDNRVKEALKHPGTFMKLNKLHCNLYKQPTCWHCADAAGASYLTSYTTEDEYDRSDPPLAPSIPWDLVQS